MTITGPRIKDFTGDTAPDLPVDIVADPLFEALLQLFVIATHDDDDLTDFAVDPAWFEQIRTLASPELATGLTLLAGLEEVWLSLVSPALDLETRTLPALATWLRELPTEAAQTFLFMLATHHGDADRQELVNAAIAGDDGARTRLVHEPSLPEPMRNLLALDPCAAAERIAGALEAFGRDVFGDGAAVAPVLGRDADHKRAMSATMKPPQLVETATNGITFTMIPDVDRIVLIPSVIIRPWVTVTDHRRARVFCYPVAEQHLDADADTPPAWLVDVYKALGDERRLRFLKILAGGAATLADVTARTDLAKSTVHHHLSVLRRAGLVRITVGEESEYSLRTDGIADASSLLAGFLNA